MSWTVYVCVVTVWSIVLYVRSIDCNTTLTLFWCVVD
ncbi:Uncharacterised protein [Vibrio cholerae]|nr:Uncharacterised protein [Vibrio cholerae]